MCEVGAAGHCAELQVETAAMSFTLDLPGLSLSAIEKGSHLGKRAEWTGGRDGILRLLTLSTASAALIHCGGWSWYRRSLSEQREPQRDSVEHDLKGNSQKGSETSHDCIYLQSLNLPCLCGMLQFELRMLQCWSPPLLLGKPKKPREVWVSGTSAEHCGTLIQAEECSRPAGGGAGSSSQTSVFYRPSVSASDPPFLRCASLWLCMGGEALAVCQSSCSGVNGQPCAHNALWTSGNPHCTNERLQARLVRISAAEADAMCCSDCDFKMHLFLCVALRLSRMHSTTKPGARFMGLFPAVSFLPNVHVMRSIL